jgi:hypothetical protein
MKVTIPTYVNISHRMARQQPIHTLTNTGVPTALYSFIETEIPEVIRHSTLRFITPYFTDQKFQPMDI